MRISFCCTIDTTIPFDTIDTTFYLSFFVRARERFSSIVLLGLSFVASCPPRRLTSRHVH